MSAVDPGPLVLDTHAVVWYLQQDRRLSPRAEAEIDRALAGGHTVQLPSICLVELVYLVEKRRIPAAVAERLNQVLTDPSFGFRLAVLDQKAAEATREVPW